MGDHEFTLEEKKQVIQERFTDAIENGNKYLDPFLVETMRFALELLGLDEKDSCEEID